MSGRCWPPILLVALCSGLLGGGLIPALAAALLVAPGIVGGALAELSLREADRDSPARVCLAVWLVTTLGLCLGVAQLLYLQGLWSAGPSAAFRNFEQLLARGEVGRAVAMTVFTCAWCAAIPALGAVWRARAPLGRRGLVYAAGCVALGAGLWSFAYVSLGWVDPRGVGFGLLFLSGCQAGWLWVVDSAAERAEAKAGAWP